ncbi:vWA domain-containing protein [Caballeronia sordidicola]|uniref:vWA domain-containing protein n=1 Tax=Caballeronia sordidicola TaxID=196367 RepID=UPI000B779D0E|nr:VWA-like domain-containing protein [Caballeronia sordidicola]
MDPRISKQRTALVLSQPFFGALALRLKVVEDPSCETLWVDGESLGYNPEYLASLNDLEVRGVIAHDVLHVANGHCWRMGARDPKRWNEACDYAVNPLVLDAGLLLPKGALLDVRFTGKSAEEIYGRLTEEARQKAKRPGKQPEMQPGKQPARGPDKQPGEPDQNDGQGQSSGPAEQSTPVPNPCGEVRPYQGEDKPTKEAEWKVAVIQAAKAAQMHGKLPGSLQAMVGEAVRPVVDWRAVLQRFAQQASPSDYSFSMPNRRYLHLGFYLPSLHMPAIADAVFVRDSSGSVTAETQAQFNAEILSTFYSLQPARLIVMDCDTRVTQVQIFERGDSPEILPVRGGGGTAFVAPFEKILAEGINPAFLVYLTDMHGRFPASVPYFPVLWASTTPLTRAKKAPFGETMEVIC